MKRYGWIMGLLVITVALAVVPMSASAQCGGGQMDHSMMESDQMRGYGQMAPGYTGNSGYANPNAAAPGQQVGTRVPAPSGQATENPSPSGHDHNH
jgi:hypothetical protein